VTNRIDALFSRFRQAGRKALIGYLTAGDPTPAASEKVIHAAIAGGVDILELGVPFSDPTADGPIIQAAAQRALAGGMTVAGALELVRRVRQDAETPVVLFGYANPFFVYGYEQLCRDAAAAGADGLLVVDLPFEEAGELRECSKRAGLHFIPLIAPTTPLKRAAVLLNDARGFVYYITVTGVTGTRDEVASDLPVRLQELRRITPLPIAVGFGISNGAQARAAARHADAVVIGSALVKAAVEGTLEGLLGEIREALG